jgi:glycosyltransferase involved in cell wall biosynthesis
MHLGRNLGRTTFVEMPHAPRISILTPTFGHAAVIGECIRSVQEQSFTDWEMIILDDGSKDGTYEAALRAGVGDARIHVYTQPNKGIFRLRENYDFMLEKASGEWLALLDGDDVWEKDKLALQWEALKSQPEAVACWGKAAVAGEDARTVLSVAPAEDHPQRHLFSNEPVGVLTGALYFDNCIPALTVLVRRSALECIGGFRQTHGQPLVDLPTLLELAMVGPFVYIPRQLGTWRTYVHQVTKTFPAAIIEGRRKCVMEHYERYHPAVDMAAVKKHYDRILIIGYSRNGRYCLVKEHFAEARKWYVKSMFFPASGSWMWRLRSFTGWLLSWFRTDVEGLAGLLGRRRYR